ncbi:MAG: hypothetical protein LBB50_02065, partial [Oscillospiraceae bacterium]|nr:hypothetical protein [Oscillospiraceae bacterium]
MAIAEKLKKPTRQTVVQLATFVLAVLFLIIGNRVGMGNRASVFGTAQEAPLLRARVIEILREEKSNYSMDGADDSLTLTTVDFEARVTAGKLRGKTIVCQQQIDSMMALAQP